MKLYDIEVGDVQPNLGIGDLSIGISAAGMEQYIESIKADLLVKCKEKLCNYDEITNAINSGWQGESRNKFMTDFTNAVVAICNDLDLEYQNLEQKMNDVKTSYYQIDRHLMGEE